MSDILKKMRHRRFNIRPSSEIHFLIETSTGAKFKLTIDNVSLNGISAWSTVPLSADDGLEIGTIVPAAKITFKDHEYALGRVVVRVKSEKDEKNWLGLSMVDGKVPIDSLSHYFVNGLEDADSHLEFEMSPDKFSMATFSENQSTNTDLFSKAHNFSVFLKDWKKTAKYSYFNIRKPSMGPRVNLTRTRKNGRTDYIVMGSNDYLGLASHPKVLEAAKQAIDEYGFGSTGAPVSTGMTEAHTELQKYLAKILNKEDVVLFNSGYTANIGIINGLLNINDLIVSDIISHASIQDAMQMSKATSRFFKHNSVMHLEKTLSEIREQHAGCMVATEGVFSMDGDVPPIDQIVATAQKYRARVMIDEAHSFGVLGATGLGACEKFGVIDQTDIIMGTFSKICGGIGGFVATTSEVAEWLRFWSRSNMFTVSIPPSSAAAAHKALEIFRNDKSLLQTLRTNIQHFTRGLAALGCQISKDHESSVIPVIVGDEKKLEVMNKVLMDAGVFVVPVVYPVVSRTNCRFRFTIMASHSISDLDYVLNTLELAMEKAEFKFQKKANPSEKAA